MMQRGSRLSKAAAIAAGLCLGAINFPAHAIDGNFNMGAGAVNSSVGGVSVAMPLDALGTLRNNPAGLNRLPRTRADFSAELMVARTKVYSNISGLSGTTNSDAPALLIPGFALSHRLRDNLTFGFGVLGDAGFSADYPQDNSNPLLAPASLGGAGHIFVNYQVLKSITAVSLRTGKFAWAAALNADHATLSMTPFIPAAANSNGTYPSAADNNAALGIGFQLGLLYELNDALDLGLSYSSPQWYEKFRWNSVDQNGVRRKLEGLVNGPQWVGMGAGFHPFEKLSVGADVKWINYSNTPGFQHSGFNADGSGQGLGWTDIWVAALGVQYKAAKCFRVRSGYNYAQIPIPDHLSSINVATPAIGQHHATVGAGFDVSQNLELNLGYYHNFRNAISGPAINPLCKGACPGTEVRNEGVANSFQFQLSYKID